MQPDGQVGPERGKTRDEGYILLDALIALALVVGAGIFVASNCSDRLRLAEIQHQSILRNLQLENELGMGRGERSVTSIRTAHSER